MRSELRMAPAQAGEDRSRESLLPRGEGARRADEGTEDCRVLVRDRRESVAPQWIRSFVVAPMLLCMLACTKPQPAVTSPVATPPANGPRIILPDNYVVHVEIAADDDTRQQGLMYRDRLPEATGMIFIFAQPNEYPFWMKNCLIPLDMVFIGADLRIVGIVVDAEPQTLTPRAVDGPSQFVLELAGGVASKVGLRAGQRVELKGL